MYQFVTLVITVTLLCSVNALAESGKIAPSAEETKPLQPGATVPDAMVVGADGEASSLSEFVMGEPTVLVFYRGGWCPYCTRHLAGLKDALPELEALGYRMVGITPEAPEEIAETIEDKELPYTILSDRDLAAAKSMGLAFDVGTVTGLALRAYGATLVERALPVPAVFLVDESGEIVFTHADPDYSERLSNEKLLAAARASITDEE